MIIKYQVENFGPFSSKEKMDFKSASIKEHQETLINIPDEKITVLPVIVLYGPNGGGKSQFLNSLILIKHLVYNHNISNFWSNYCNVYTNYSNPDKNVCWTIEFWTKTSGFLEYKLKINKNGVEHESLSIKNKYKSKYKELFSIKKSEISLSDDNKNNLSIIENIMKQTNSLFLFTMANMIGNTDARVALNEIFNIKWIDNSLDNTRIKDPFLPIINIKFNDIKFLESNKNQYLEIFKDIDINIVDLKFIRNPLNDKDIQISVVKNGEFGELLEKNLYSESTGTLKFIFIITDILKSIKNNSIIVIDEIDSGIHTKLLEYIIKIFTSQTETTAQLIFTSHDMGTLSNKVFRRDEIYFSSMNESFFSTIVSLYELGIRNDVSFSKNYREGKFGNDPYIDFSLKSFYGK